MLSPGHFLTKCLILGHICEAAVPVIFEHAQGDWADIELTKLSNYQVFGNAQAVRFHPFEFHSIQTVTHNEQSHLVVGAKRSLVVLKHGNLSDSREFKHFSITEDKKMCEKVGRSYCDNYVTSIMDVESNVTLCGTNSNNPQLFSIEKNNLFDDRWWDAHMNSDIADISKAYSDRGSCPYVPCDTSLHVSLSATKRMFMATVNEQDDMVADMVGTFSMNLVTSGERHTRQLNHPKFIFGTEYNDHVVMLFREGVMAEKAEEESNRAQWPNSVRGEVARIGFVCKADGDLDTLIKATLRCQLGDREFPVLVAAEQAGDKIYAIFRSREETLRQSALCVYSLADISRQMRDSKFLA